MTEEEEEYDPHLHRVEMVKHPITNMETVFHLIKGCLGTGVLALPEAFKMSGMANGIISTAIIGIFCTYCLHILFGAQYVLCKKRKVGLLLYSNSMYVACDVGPEFFKPYGTIMAGLTDFILIFYQVGTCCIYVVFCGTSTKYIMDVYVPEKLQLYIYMLILFVPFIALLLIRNLKRLAPFSLVGDIVTILTFAVVFYYIAKTLKNKFTDRPSFGKIVDYPILIGTVLFSLQSVPIVVAIENDMATPKSFCQPFGPLNVSFAFLTVLYIIVAIMGYWCYGDDVKAPITMNFPIKEIFAQVVIFSYCFAIFISYGLNAYVPLSIIWDNYIVEKLDKREMSDAKKLMFQYLLRLVFAIVTFVLATTVPLLGLFISLVGSAFLSMLGVIFPAFMEIAANWEEEKTRPGTALFWKNIVIMIIGLFALLSGAYSSIRAMVETLISGDY